ncbi:uncharacterized protein LOC126829542 isoform X2 [Patella vulgata]|uniref:uncharacterized protein LOC126829542 isoform X2 n=1 Tax=Patella vulgata TaxID=6465 RepID=UPI0021805ECB|nr:uncharacterized protein LOC126829542 isoform X2 [Patella vulgata]
MLNEISSWCYKWRLSVNQSKTKIVHFRPSTWQVSERIFTIGNLNIDYCESYKYLGLWLDGHLNFNLCVNELSKSASRALAALCSKHFQAGGFPYNIFTRLYESLVQPIILYGARIWGITEHHKLNSVQNRACKVFLGLKRNSPNLAARGDMGWTSCLTKQRTEVLRLFCRLKSLPSSRLPVIISNWSLRRAKSWEKNVHALVKNLRISHICDVESINKSHLKALKRHLFQNDESKWFQELWNDSKNPNGNKLRTYRLFKKDLKPESYVLVNNLPRHIRKATSLLRSGSSDLMIETLRYSHPPTPCICRLCPFCSEIETESHFLIECKMYSDLRY